MRITDWVALISYPGIIVNLLVISYHILGSFHVQLRNRILLWIVVFTAEAVLALGGAITLFFYNRIMYVAVGLQTPLWVSDASAIFWAFLFQSLTCISYLYLSKNTKRYINLERKRK